MQVGIIMKSDLDAAGRWDAGFHLLNAEYRDQADAIALTMSAGSIMAILCNPTIPLEALNCLAPLVRGRNTKLDRTQLQGAVREYPFLAMAVMKDKSAAILEEHQAQLAKSFESLEQCKTALRNAGPEISGLEKLSNSIRAQTKSNNFVKGVVYFDGDTLSIPVDTSKTAYVADCWVIDLEDWTGPEVIDNLIAEGNVPVPRRPEDLGKPIGYLSALGDHTQNYNRGWC